MSTATRNRPLWHRLRDALADIERGLYPNRAFDFHRIPKHWRDDQRIAVLASQAEATLQRNAVAAIANAGSQLAETRELPVGLPDNRQGRARVSARTWTNKDWRAPAWLLERRFPAEYGAQQPQQVASAVVDVLHALAALRDQPAQLAVHRPLALADGKQERARAREGRGTP